MNGKLTLDSTKQDPFFIAVKGTLTGLDPKREYAWTILRASERFDGPFNPNNIAFDLTQFSGLLEGMMFSLAVQDEDLVLKLAVVPEPGQTALLLTAAAAVWAFSRRKRTS